MERKWDSISPFYDTLPAMARKEDGHDAPVTAGKWSLLPYGTHEPKAEMTRSSGNQKAERTARRLFAPRKALWCARRRSPIFPYEGLTRRLRRGSGTCRPMGLSHFSFDGERKVCKRKPAARHSRGGPPRCASRASACGSRTVGCPEFIRGIQFRPLGRNSLTTFRGQTALRGCPRPRLAALTRRKKAFIAHFDGGARNVARNEVG